MTAPDRRALVELIRSPLFQRFLAAGFWDASRVDLVWRHSGRDVREEADWLKDVWYAIRRESALTASVSTAQVQALVEQFQRQAAALEFGVTKLLSGSYKTVAEERASVYRMCAAEVARLIAEPQTGAEP